MDPRIYTDNVLVRCPFSNGMRYNVFIRFAIREGGQKFYFPSDGCCNMSGSETCARCRAFVTLRMNGLDCPDEDYSDFHIG